jgi:hypothetical protein
MNENLALWDSVRTPDPAHTKAFNRGGGFKGTATSPTYLIRVATEKWGPMGGNWGIEIVSDTILQGAPLLAKDGTTVIGHEQVHVCRINLRHPGGVVPAFGQTQFVGVNKYGPFTDEEAPKKSLTDALTKAMSWLGFAADVHLGLWDDMNYVRDVKRAKAEEREAAQNAQAGGDDDEGPARIPAATLEKHKAAIKAAANQDELKAARDAAKADCEQINDTESYQEISTLVRDRATAMATTGTKKASTK